MNLWIPKDLVNFYAPYGFQEEYPATRVIIDGTECPVKKPALPTAQQATFSTYKNRNTSKVLIEVSPGGLCSYDVQDIFAPYGVTVNIPTFFRKKNQMSGETVIHDQKVASKQYISILYQGKLTRIFLVLI